MTSVAVLERFTRVAPLGVRLRDAAIAGFLSEGLSVEAYPEGAPEHRTPGLVNRRGVFVFRNLPGLRAVEQGEGDAAYWAAQVPRYPFVLEVRDSEERFLPYRLDVKLPVRRLLGLLVGSPLASPLAGPGASSAQSLPLFSSPSRRPPDAMGVLRAEIVDSVTGEPAAWALLEAAGPGQALAAGLADAQGRVMLPLPYPKPVVSLGSPGSPATPLTDQAWTVDFTVRYERRAPAPPLPDLAEILTQPPATVWRDTSRTTPLTQGTLRFGRELVLASLGDGGQPSPNLLITPAGPPA